MSDFIFRVEDFHLTKEQKTELQGQSGATVMTELAKVDLSSEPHGGPSEVCFMFIPI